MFHSRCWLWRLKSLAQNPKQFFCPKSEKEKDNNSPCAWQWYNSKKKRYDIPVCTHMCLKKACINFHYCLIPQNLHMQNRFNILRTSELNQYFRCNSKSIKTGWSAFLNSATTLYTFHEYIYPYYNIALWCSDTCRHNLQIIRKYNTHSRKKKQLIYIMKISRYF